jgi:hypothetical protein
MSEPTQSCAAEVVADGSGKFFGNALRFATVQEAEAYARDLMGRWMLVTEWRVVPSDEPVNYQWDPKQGAVSIETQQAA